VSQLIVRNIEEKVVRKLRVRAAADGVSMEEEHRRILRKALLEQNKRGKTFAEHLLAIPKASADEPRGLFERQRDLPREIEL